MLLLEGVCVHKSYTKAIRGRDRRHFFYYAVCMILSSAVELQDFVKNKFPLEETKEQSRQY